MGDKGLAAALEKLGAQVQRGAVAIGCVIQLSRLRLGAADKVLHFSDARGGVHQQHIGHPAQQGHRSQLRGLVRQVFVDGRADGERGRCHQQRVSVGGSAGYFGRPHIAAGPRFVVNHHGLAQFLRKPAAHQSSHVVDQSAGRERHHQADRPRWPGLRHGQGGSQQQQGTGGGSHQSAFGGLQWHVHVSLKDVSG